MKRLLNIILKMLKTNNFDVILRNILLKTLVFFTHYFVVFFGLFLFTLVIYLNFIRERLPRDIPFILTEFRFYILMFICFTYLYIIKSILYPKAPHHLVISILSKIIKPFYLFLNALLGINFIYKINDKFILKLITILDSWYDINFAFFIYIIQLFPRIILLSIFIVDVFWLHKIEAFYYCIILSVFPLIYNLFIVYINYSLENLIKYLEFKYTKVSIIDKRFLKPSWEPDPNAMHHGTTVSVRKYLDIQYEAFKNSINNNIDIEYEGDAYSTEKRYDDYMILLNKKNLTIEDYDYLNKDFNFYMPEIIKLKIFMETFYKTTPTEFYIPQVKLIIIFAYLITWLYILCVSIHTLQDITLTMNLIQLFTKYLTLSDPFSMLNISD